MKKKKKKNDIYYELLMQREAIAFKSLLSLWGVSLVMNVISAYTLYKPVFAPVAQVLGTLALVAGILYAVARKEFQCKKPMKVQGKVLGFKSKTFEPRLPLQYKRNYAIVKTKTKKKYVCLEPDGLQKGDVTEFYKYNNTLIPIFKEYKPNANSDHS